MDGAVVLVLLVVAIAGAIGFGVFYRRREQQRKAEDERTKAETEQQLVTLVATLRQMERAGSGQMKELHPLDKLARGAVLGEQRKLITIDWVKGKMFVGLTRAGRQGDTSGAPQVSSTPLPP